MSLPLHAHGTYATSPSLLNARSCAQVSRR